MMASRALARVARSGDDYRTVYGELLSQTREKAVLHWLGDMFDPQLAGYWGSHSFDTALETVLAIINDNRDKVEGIKISLLDNRKEVELRKRLPEGVLCFTGDDFNYAELIEGDGTRYSHALLGIFDAVAPSASKALSLLAKGESSFSRGDRADGSVVPQDLRGSDPILQGRRRVPRLAQRPPKPFHHASRHAIGTRDRPLCGYFPAG